jgi:hypothetical protein
MDEIVKLAIQKWPNVPACYGWLGLDARGDWYLRDDAVQRRGTFKHAKGDRLQHHKLIDFIKRNYQQDELGGYYFQNGPQKVFVELELTPWILRFDHALNVTTHTDLPVVTTRAYTDETGRAYLLSNLGLGLVHSMDMEHFADELEKQRWPLSEISTAELEQQFGYLRSPFDEKKAGLGRPAWSVS